MPGSTRGKGPSTQTALTAHHATISPNGVERQRVTDIQRARMLTAVAEATVRRGAANVTVAHVVQRAGVSRRTFYEIFSDVESCLLAALEHALQQASERVRDAFDPKARWTQRMRASLVALLSFLGEDPVMGRLMVVESLSAGEQALRRRQDVLARVIAAVDEGRGESKTTAGPPPLTAEGTVGGVLSILHARLSEDAHEPLSELAGPLMSMIALPYLGQSAARRELKRKAPVLPLPRRRDTDQNQLHKLGMRLTYRTILVLAALASHPGLSNRQVAREAGIADQGQTSKLLARLQQLGLIENTSAGSAGRGAPNAWTLTAKGWQVHGELTRSAGS